MSAFAIPTGIAVLREIDFAREVTESLADTFTLLMRRQDRRLCRTAYSVGKFLKEGLQQIWLMRIIASVHTYFAGAQDNFFTKG